MKSVVLISGGFDPIHSGHINYINESNLLGNRLVVALNSDEWLSRKKGCPFMTFAERKAILLSIKGVDEVYAVDDSDGTVKDAIRYCLESFSGNIIFANGGDRTRSNIPEMEITDSRLSFAFGVGGEKKQNSSSKILAEWKNPKTYRKWGYYRVLHSDGPETKVKELVVNPNESLSLQRHKYRAEHWTVTEGTATVLVGTDDIVEHTLYKHDTIDIPTNAIHKLINNTDRPLKIVEIQYGSLCCEEDIERI